MALPTQIPPSNQADHLALAQIYARTAPRDEIADGLKEILPALSKCRHLYKDGHLYVLMGENFLTVAAGVLVRAVEHNDALADRIILLDPQTRTQRSYHDVVWDIEKQPLKIARLAYQSAAYAPLTQILVTPSVLGNNSKDRSQMDCRKIMMPDSPVAGLGMVVRLSAKDSFDHASEWHDIDLRRNQRQIVQTRNVTMSGIDDFQFPNPVMVMDVAVAPACIRNFPSVAYQPGAEKYDRQI